MKTQIKRLLFQEGLIVLVVTFAALAGLALLVLALHWIIFGEIRRF